ncbi:MAG: ECF-type sigma factor, partial [Acidobacteriota bacterium]
RLKHGGAVDRVSFDELQAVSPEPSTELLELDRALSDLAELDGRKAKVIELIYFGGLTYDEVALVLDISRATAHRDLRLAKAWLHDRIAPLQLPAE